MPDETPIELVRRLEFVERKRAVLQRRLSQKFSEEDTLVWSIADLMTLLLIFFVMLYARSGGGFMAQPLKVPLNGGGDVALAAALPDEPRQLASLMYGKVNPGFDPLWGPVQFLPLEGEPAARRAADPPPEAPEDLPAAAAAEGAKAAPPVDPDADGGLLAEVRDFQLGPLPPPSASGMADDGQAGLAEDVRCFLEQHQDRDIDVRWEKDRAVFVLGERITFHVGSAELREDFLETLEQIAALIVTRQNYEVAVSGHTDDTPIHTRQFPSNWELSAIRAVNVAKFLSASGVNPQQLYIQGFSEYRPQKTNDSTENKEVNRRVEIALINPAPAS